MARVSNEPAHSVVGVSPSYREELPCVAKLIAHRMHTSLPRHHRFTIYIARCYVDQAMNVQEQGKYEE